jgi:hypothetical protein
MLRTGVAVAIALTMGGCKEKRENDGTGWAESKADLADTGVKKLAFECYPQWAARPRNTGRCPTVAELADFGGSRLDPWGNEFVVGCSDLPPGAVGIAVSSNGADGKQGTADDVQSWR